MRHNFTLILILIITLAGISGCVLSSPQQPSYKVNDAGYLELSIIEPPLTFEKVENNNSITVTQLYYPDIGENIHAILASPVQPRAAIILAPGAGVKKEGHIGRAEEYAKAGYAFMVLDIRGNGGETSGYPFNLDEDYRRYSEGQWPQFYAIVRDLICARELLDSRYHVPIYIMGESNGGRYAAIAAAADKRFSGYIGVSTSGFNLIGNQYIGKPRQFLLSIDPDHSIQLISPRPVMIFHSQADTIIPYSDGVRLYVHANEPKVFLNFSTGHGLTSEVDQKVIEMLHNFMSAEGQ